MGEESAAGGNSLAGLKAIVGQIVGKLEKAAEIKDEIADIYAEAKDDGYDVAVLRQVVGEMADKGKLDKHIEREIIVDTYRQRLGLIGDGADPHRAKLEAIAASLQKMGVSVNLGVR